MNKATYIPTIMSHYVRGKDPTPQSVIDERNRRLALEPRDLTAHLQGDPLPGFSALDKYNRDLVSA